MHSPVAEIALRKASRTALVVRWLVSVHIASLLLQLVSAIAAVGGAAAAFHTHATNARLVAVAGLLQAIGVLSVGSPRAGWFVRTMAVAIPVVEAAQLYLGLGAGIAMHVTLAMVLWGFGLAIFIRVWAPSWTRED
jgi:hypothetical protein